MATNNKKKQDEKHLKMLRELVSLPSNKQCFDCNQRGPTYVNMTIGSFVCTACSGILRGLNPPHRIKSISMASFSPEEMDFLISHGNELNRRVYLGLHDSQTWPEPDSRDEQKVREFMIQKYEHKRWYVAATDAMKEQAKWANEAALNSKPQVKPLRSMLGENAIKTSPVSTQPQAVLHAPAQISVPLPGAVKTPIAVVAPQSTPSNKATAGFDLFADFGSDPFAATTTVTSSNGNADSFADFSNFSSFSSLNSSPVHQPTVAAPVAGPSMFPVSATPLQPSAKGQQAQSIAHKTPAAPSFTSGGDKYAALADLDSVFAAPVTPATSINWGGSEPGGALNWGGTASTAGSSWAGGSSGTAGGEAMNWNNPGPVGVSTAAPNLFGSTPTAFNPFGASPAGAASFPGLAPASTVNPFLTSVPAASKVAQAGLVAPPGYGNQFAAPAVFGGFSGVQNGGFGGVGPAGASSFSQPFMMSQPGVSQPAAAGGWAQLGGPAPASNPFMNTVTPRQVQPPSGSTNPFL